MYLGIHINDRKKKALNLKESGGFGSTWKMSEGEEGRGEIIIF